VGPWYDAHCTSQFWSLELEVVPKISKNLCISALKEGHFVSVYVLWWLKSLSMKAPGLEPMISGEKLKREYTKVQAKWKQSVFFAGQFVTKCRACKKFNRQIHTANY